MMKLSICISKTVRILLACVCTSALFSGCGSAPAAPAPAASSVEPAGSSAPVSQESQETEVRKIGIVQIMEHPSLNQIRESFLSELENLGYDSSKVEIDYKNANSEQSNLTSICQTFAGDKKDLIVAIATPSAQAAAAAAPEIPLVFSAVTDPVSAGLVTDPAKPEGLITGTSDAIAVDQIFGLMEKLTPGVQTVGMIYNLGEDNSVSVISNAKAFCDANGIAYTEATVTNSSEVQQAALSLVGKCQAIFTPIDNTVASAMPVLSQVAIENKIPVYPGADSMVIDGGFATVGVDYILLGRQTAAMAVKVLEGTPVADVPVETLTEVSTIINKTTAEALGIEVPEEILSNATVVG